MSYLPLVLSVKAKNWRKDDAESQEADAEFRHVRRKVLERDDFTCRFCGFRAVSWQEVHHANDDHTDNRLQNLVTACQFCHACQHIGLAGQFETGILAWIPEIPQDRLHHLVRSLMVAQHWAKVTADDRRARPDLVRASKEISDVAGAVMAKLRARQAGATERLGTSSLQDLANLLLLMPEDHYARRDKFLTGMRLLPISLRAGGGPDREQKILDVWLEGPYANVRPNAWVGLLRSAMA